MTKVKEIPEALLTTIEVAEVLRIHPLSVRRLVRQGRLREVNLGWRTRRFHRTDVERYLAEKS